ncbi:mechanosensitive ion channel family protein [Stieleria sp. TO1_6]|uniref:mechanosensitive ion channel family protein n=1 Tax=Stieleria tagensis TaxID=2956795 RepID=UPI00209A6CBC|nr:mechanosensitive ion channel domain-containing protein [Stieleria tagensis]MCO8124187.1 mechanosensitive ion channel family protein [Stieleria tagensis]
MLEIHQPIRSFIQAKLEQQLGLSEQLASLLTAATGFLVVLLIAFAVDRMASWAIRSLVPSIIARLAVEKHIQWVQAIRQRLVARRSAHVIAALTVYALVPYALDQHPDFLALVKNLIESYMVIVVVIALNAMLRAGSDVIVDERLPSGVSLRFASQAAQIVLWVVGCIFIVSVLFDVSVTVLLSGMAGMTAILVLVFRDSILGFVAGIQLAGNDLLRIGDWIEMPQFGTDGVVTDIGLTTVKVQNFDKTISTIPSYALVSESFRNWRGMKESGSRRIMRSIAIDMDGIRFLDDQMHARLSKMQLLRDYFAAKENQLTDFNTQLGSTQPDGSEWSAADKRRLTNLGTFRAYLEQYLLHHPDMRSDMTVIVRQLPPGPDGLPIQLYVFSKVQDWNEYERIQADVFDHVIAIMPEFGLRHFQWPKSNPVTPSTDQ